MDFAIADLLELPLLQASRVLNEGAFDPYRPVAASLLSDQGCEGRGLFHSVGSDSLDRALTDRSGWPVLCLVGPGQAPQGPELTTLFRRAASRRIALLWLETTSSVAELQPRLHRELLVYHQAQIEASLRIQRRLQEIVVTGGTMQTICRALALATGNPVSIKTCYNEVVAFYDVGNPDSARRRTNEAGRVPADIVTALNRADLPEQLQREVGAFRFGPLPEIDYHSRVMASIRTESALWGYISIAETSRKLGILYLQAVEAAANCASLLVWKGRALEQRAREQQAQYIGDLLFAEQDPEAVAARAVMLGYDINDAASAVVFEWVPSRRAGRVENGPTDGQLREAARFIDTHLAAHGARALVRSVVVGGRVVCLWPTSADDPQEGAGSVLKRLNTPGFDGVRAGIGSPILPGSPSESAAQSYRRALLACRLTAPEVRVASYEDLGLARIIVENLSDAELRGLADRYLCAIEEYDQLHRGELMSTLAAFFASGRNFPRTAEQLVVHANTVKYRLRRCSEVSGFDLEDPATALNVEIALVVRNVLRATRAK
ncbi:PucR family transcriptional regulator [Sporichthya polymorpha]|uniref:PucR family transcriptional regulator n=1 Tax=Sporichthya polymorpha TaxID=35751 RepID=UPI0012EC0A9F|nr:PucR family transcriptional regulator [Sporichthya polymorpha]